MRFSYIATACLAISESTVQAVSLPQSDAISIQQEVATSPRSDILAPEHALEKRKGGGGKGGGGGSSSSSSSGGKTGSSGSSTSGSRAPNAGGSTSAGSGAARSFGGGKVYGGGAAVPYKAGSSSKTPGGLVAGGAIGLGAAAVIMPGLWLYSVYPYYYHNSYRFYNQSARKNETLPVVCLCQENSTCGCDETPDQANVKELVGSGDWQGYNKSQITVSDVNGTRSIVLNGTLPDGTTAPGGTDGAGVALSFQYGGYWVAGLIVVYTCAFM